MNIFLKEPTLMEKKEIVEMATEFNESNDEYPFEGISNLKIVIEKSYEEFLNDIKNNKNIDKINPNYANQITYVLIDDMGHIYGMLNLRNELKGNLINIGGNVGYAIRPSERGKGYGSLQLKLILEKANSMDLEKLLITCRENNIGSRKTMEKFIGQPDTLVDSMHPEIKEYRYWIDVKKNLDLIKKL